jgi:uncharacterized protein YehS (DUF1456 family)
MKIIGRMLKFLDREPCERAKDCLSFFGGVITEHEGKEEAFPYHFVLEKSLRVAFAYLPYDWYN